MLRISPMSSSPATCGVVIARVSFGLRISSLERLEPLDLPAVRFDTERDDERGERHQYRRCQYETLPQVRIRVEHALGDGPDQLAPKCAKGDIHEEINGRDLTAKLIGCDALDSGILRYCRCKTAYQGTAEANQGE